MQKTLPKAPKSLGRTRHVLNSAVSAIKGEANPLGFSKVSSAIVILVDGLGYRQLEQVSGHAPSLWKNAKPILSAFPATTSNNIKSFATGLMPCDHGFLGYRLRHNQGISNLLSDMDKYDIQEFSSAVNIPEQNTGVDISTVSMQEYENSGFSKLTMGGSKFVPGETIEERFKKAREITKKSNQLVYLYIPELDKTGHKQGWGSDLWLSYLEQVESEIRKFDLPNVGLVLISDHGMVNTNQDLQVHLDEYIDGTDIEAITGDTRCNYLHTKLSLEEVTERLMDEPVDVYSAEQIEQAGWFGGEVRAEFRYRLPELVLIARGDHVLLHKHFNTERAYKMIGHHGTFDSRELEVPLMRIGI